MLTKNSICRERERGGDRKRILVAWHRMVFGCFWFMHQHIEHGFNRESTRAFLPVYVRITLNQLFNRKNHLVENMHTLCGTSIKYMRNHGVYWLNAQTTAHICVLQMKMRNSLISKFVIIIIIIIIIAYFPLSTFILICDL